MDNLRERSGTSKDPEGAHTYKDVQETLGIDKHAADGHDDPISSKRKRILLLACICILGARVSLGGHHAHACDAPSPHHSRAFGGARGRAGRGGLHTSQGVFLTAPRAQ